MAHKTIALTAELRELREMQVKAPASIWCGVCVHLFMRLVARAEEALSAVGFEPTRSYLQWILSPPP